MEEQIKATIEQMRNSMEYQKAKAEKLFAQRNNTEARYFEGLATANEYAIEKLEKIINQ